VPIDSVSHLWWLQVKLSLKFFWVPWGFLSITMCAYSRVLCIFWLFFLAVGEEAFTTRAVWTLLQLLLVECIVLAVPPQARGTGNINSGLDTKRWRAEGNKIKSREIKERVVSCLLLLLSTVILVELIKLAAPFYPTFFCLLVLSGQTCLI